MPGEPIHISDTPFLQELEAMCVRMTGKTLAEWERETIDRLQLDIASRTFPINRLFTTSEMISWSKRYGLISSDFEALKCPINTPGVYLTTKEQAAINAWDESGKPCSFEFKEQWYQVNSRIKGVIRHRYIGPGAPKRTPPERRDWDDD